MLFPKNMFICLPLLNYFCLKSNFRRLRTLYNYINTNKTINYKNNKFLTINNFFFRYIFRNFATEKN